MLTTVMDSACGYAAQSMLDVDSAVLTIEFKVNLMRPAKGLEFPLVFIVGLEEGLFASQRSLDEEGKLKPDFAPPLTAEGKKP